MNLHELSAVEIATAIRQKKISAVEAVRHFNKRIEGLDKKLNSFISLNSESESDARKVDEKIQRGQDVGRLAGVPVAVKDMICTKNLRTTAASKILHNFIPPYSATLVERLQAEGAIVIGKTNLDEFAMGSSNENSASGPCRNPWNPEYVPGGSSGGSAASVAARLAPVSIGTDTGGSIRQPASFCGVYGIKPTYGRISRNGVIAFASSLDQAGPMANNTMDCALFTEVMSGVCKWDSTTSEKQVPRWSEETKPSVKGLRIGLPKEYFSQKMDPDVEKSVQNAIECLRVGGAEVKEVSLSLVKYAVSVYYLVAASEASSNLARYDGVRFGYRHDFSKHPAKDLEEFYSLNRGEGFGAEVKRRIVIGTYALSTGYYDAYYQKAGQVRRLMQQQFQTAFSECDVILSPVTTSPAFKIGERITDPLQMYLNDIFTTSHNLAGIPGMSVPAGFSKLGLPIGVQLTGKHFDEQTIFNVSSYLEENLALERRTPSVY